MIIGLVWVVFIMVNYILSFKIRFISNLIFLVPLNMEKMETDQEKTELNKLNVQLVDKLRSSDNAFSLGESTDGVACVR